MKRWTVAHSDAMRATVLAAADVEYDQGVLIFRDDNSEVIAVFTAGSWAYCVGDVDHVD